jgi:hypothetical protein
MMVRPTSLMTPALSRCLHTASSDKAKVPETRTPSQTRALCCTGRSPPLRSVLPSLRTHRLLQGSEGTAGDPGTHAASQAMRQPPGASAHFVTQLPRCRVETARPLALTSVNPRRASPHRVYRLRGRRTRSSRRSSSIPVGSRCPITSVSLAKSPATARSAASTMR